jgi:hypothetical protein
MFHRWTATACCDLAPIEIRDRDGLHEHHFVHEDIILDLAKGNVNTRSSTYLYSRILPLFPGNVVSFTAARFAVAPASPPRRCHHNHACLF